ncbi:uncharacterized protein HMPREF1541_09318 [Cyphellophora europaea CBS 101466]|uniref:Thioredoxin domain-containing protein n=1 Tax=Cyphellophora europaea (strain CBS 101466) TaxID=1220924 RepID=W2S9T6_CYPE1|nr:uncharacterized protein HMPREF1541_09318 [Cyphellophora europaea CBS 101466]ETN45486.1 hypothetical protein HMPREF1541_09318 [Cyphellophora europaea CBS 101466]
MFTSLSSRTAASLVQSSRTQLRQLPSRSKYFHSTPANMVKVGDSIPSIELFRANPGDKVNIADATKSGKSLIIGVPAAYSPGCSETHIPGYLGQPEKLKEYSGRVYIVSVNDAFVMNAWAKTFENDLNVKLTQKSGEPIASFLGDADGSFTKALDIQFDASPLLGNHRAKRSAILVEDGKVTKVAIEPDNTGITVSSVEKFLA